MTYPNLKAELARRGLTTNDVATAAAVSPRTVRNWFNGKGAPSIEQCKAIKSELLSECTVDELFT